MQLIVNIMHLKSFDVPFEIWMSPVIDVIFSVLKDYEFLRLLIATY